MKAKIVIIFLFLLIVTAGTQMDIICQFSSSSWIFLLLFSIDDDDRGEEFKGALLAFLKAVLSTTGAAGCGVQV